MLLRSFIYHTNRVIRISYLCFSDDVINVTSNWGGSINVDCSGRGNSCQTNSVYGLK